MGDRALTTTAGETGPVAASQRLAHLDQLRGIALLGIMFVNMTWFTGFAVLSPQGRAALGTGPIDGVVDWLVHALVEGKFWSLFALLFGAGFAIQWTRSGRAAEGSCFGRLFGRRLGVLFLIGAAHAILLWFGDIVSIYAVAGVALLFFRRCRDRTLLWWAAALLLSPVLLNGCWLAVDLATRTPGAEQIDPGHGPAALLVYFGGGSYAEAFSANLAFLLERWEIAVYNGRFLTALGLFLLGVWAVRRGIAHEPCHHVRLLRRLFAWGLVIGVPAGALLATLMIPLRPPSGRGLFAAGIASIGTPALGVAYAAGLTLALQRPIWRHLGKPFACVGRMSLTNYVLQSVFGGALFYGYGLGLWGRVGITWSIAFIAAIFSIQVVASASWLRWFDYGPLEWLWRSLTYGRWLSLRRPPTAAPASSRVVAPTER